jgi:hypothetical protein
VAVWDRPGGVRRIMDGTGPVRRGRQGEVGTGDVGSRLAAHGRSGDARNDLAGQDRA